VMENCEGKWPFWLSPKQLMIVPLHEKDEMLSNYATEVLTFVTGLRDVDTKVPISGGRYFNAKVDRRRKTLSQKVAIALQEYNFVAVIGYSEVKNRTVMLEGWKFPPREVSIDDMRDLFIKL